MKLDLDFVRSQFPAFSQPALEGQAFFENAGGSYPCSQVVARLTRFYRERKVQPYGAYAVSQLAGEEMDEARTRLAAMLNVEADEVSFGPSTSQNAYVLAQAFGQFLKPGDAVVVTDQDHEANSGPWRRLADRGIDIREWKLDADSGHLPIESLKALLDERVKLVCFPHCSNVVAEINPVAEIAALAHDAGAYVCVDGVAYAPHGFPNVGKLGADIYLFSSYKTYGPHQGVMVVRRALAEQLPNQGHYFNAGSLGKRFTPAGPDHAQIAACAGMADYVDAIYARHAAPATSVSASGRTEFVHDLQRAHETEILQPLLDYLSEKNSVRLIGLRDAKRRAPTIAIVLREAAESAALKLAPKGVMAGGGSFYANRCLQGLGVDPDHGALRMSFVHYTSQDEVAKLIRALDEIL
jgi:selenocysteine lyase/cysteine desulfurase